jgi:hypothetical protein
MHTCACRDMGHSRGQQLLLGLKLVGTLRLVYADALRPKLLAAYVAHHGLGPAAHHLVVARRPARSTASIPRHNALTDPLDPAVAATPPLPPSQACYTTRNMLFPNVASSTGMANRVWKRFMARCGRGLCQARGHRTKNNCQPRFLVLRVT